MARHLCRPYAKRGGHVAHTEVEFATLLRFTEQTLGLRSLGATDDTPYLHDLNDFFQSKPEPFASVDPREPTTCKTLAPRRNPHVHSRWARMIDD